MNRVKSMVLAGAALVATAAVAAFAQGMPHGGPGGPGGMQMPTTRVELQKMITDHFKAADTNKDGVVTRAEFDAAGEVMRKKIEADREAERVARRGEMFAALDKNHDGALSKDEFTAPPPPPTPGKPGADMRGGPGGPGGPDMPPPPPGAGPDGGPGGPGFGGPDGPGGRNHGMGGHRGMMRHHGGDMGDRWFYDADANKDGKLTLAEASAKPLERFDKVDTNHDGTISPAEKEAAMQMMRGHGMGWRH